MKVDPPVSAAKPTGKHCHVSTMINAAIENFKSQLKTEVEVSDNTSLKLNTNSNGKNSSSTNSGSNEKNSFSKTYFPLNNLLEEENKNKFNSDDYDIIKLIGEGTFGKIYLVQYPLNHIKFALKKISASSMEEINEKKKEYELLIKLHYENPNLNTVKIYGIQTKKLDKLKIGDEASITYKGKTYNYKVVSIYDVVKNGEAVIKKEKNTTTMTLITCRHGTNKQIVIIFEQV